MNPTAHKPSSKGLRTRPRKPPDLVEWKRLLVPFDYAEAGGRLRKRPYPVRAQVSITQKSKKPKVSMPWSGREVNAIGSDRSFRSGSAAHSRTGRVVPKSPSPPTDHTSVVQVSQPWEFSTVSRRKRSFRAIDSSDAYPGIREQRWRDRSLTLSPEPTSPGMDPFDSLSVPVQRREDIAGLDFYLNYWGPNQGFSRQFGNLSPFIATAFSLAKSDAGLLHSILSFSWGMISHLKGQSLSSPVCLSRGKSIMYLRGKLEHPQAFISSSSILTVCFLMTVDILMGNLIAASAHRDGLISMVRSIGTTEDLEEKFGYSFKSVVLSADTYSAWALSKPPFFSTSQEPIEIRYPSHPFSPELCETLGYCPSGFLELTLQRQSINEELIGVLSRAGRFFSLRRLIARKQTTPSTMSPSDRRFSMRYWTYAEDVRIVTILQRLEHIKTISSNQPLELECCICLSLLIVLRNHTKRARTTLVYMRERQRSSKRILAYPADNRMDAASAECFTWACLVMAESWWAGKMPVEEEMPEPFRLVEMIQRVNGKSVGWDQLKTILRRLLWDDDLMKSWQTFWEGMTRVGKLNTLSGEPL